MKDEQNFSAVESISCKGEVGAAMESLRSTHINLRDAIQHLETRLAPLLREELKDTTADQQVGQCALGSDIVEQVQQAERMWKTVEDLIERLEV